MRLLGLMQKAEQVLFSSKTDGVPKAYLTSARKPSMSLRSLFDTRAELIASYVDKLKDTGHPILAVASDLCLENSNPMCSLPSSLQLRAILVLLVTKAIGLSPSVRAATWETQEKVESKQYSISQITELIYAAHVLHGTVVNASDPQSQLHLGNKIASLMGDLLLAKSSRLLSDLKNNRVTELMSQAICDFAESQFVGGRNDSLNHNDPQARLNVEEIRERLTYDTWLRRSELSLGSLLGHACFSSAMCGGHDTAVQKFAFHAGRQVGITLQAHKDIRVFLDEDGVLMKRPELFDPLNLSVIYEAERLASKGGDFDSQMIFDQVQSSPIAIPRARESLLGFQQDAVRLFRQIEPKTYETELLTEILETFSS